jgi:hypothetical protein
VNALLDGDARIGATLAEALEIQLLDAGQGSFESS